jgi:PAS domain S-box-containing protein
LSNEAQLSTVLSEFARTLLTEFPIQAILDGLVERIVDVLPIDAAGVNIISPGLAPRYMAGSNAFALRCEELQSELGEGPCFDAFHGDLPVAVPDLRLDGRYPAFGAKAVEAGLLAVFAFPLRGAEGPLGALDIYRERPGMLPPDAMAAAQTLADVAAAYLHNARGRAELLASVAGYQRVAAIVESSNDSIISWSLQGDILSWNSGSERMYGHRAEEAVGRGLDLIVPTDRRSQFDSMHARVAGGEAVPTFETERVTKDGVLLDVALTVSPIRDATGAVVGLSDVGRDISESRRAAAALHASEAHKTAILSSARDAIITIDHQGRIHEFNPAAERMFGHQASTVIGRALVDVILPQEDRPRHVAELAQCIATGDAPYPGLRRHLTMLRADGSRFPTEVSLSKIDSVESVLMTGFVRDRTEEVADEAERRSLEARVSQSHRLESLGQLAGGVAHDFNNLLAVILNYANFVGEAVGDRPDVQADIEKIVSASKRAVGLTRQLLMFARHEPIVPRNLDLNAVLAEVHGILSTSVGENVALVVHAGSRLPSVCADQGQLEQLLVNLSVNARDAMPEGGLLTLETSQVVLDAEYERLHPSTPAGRYVQLTVTDNGDGMTPEVAARAFDPFFTTKSKAEGTGLGLSTVYGIVSKAGGAVSIYSAPGVGTTVRVYLPAISGAAEGPLIVATATPKRASGERILVVEDQDDVREVTVRILRRNGYSVLEASSAAEAIELAAGCAIDLVLTDVVMPTMTGQELVEHLRALTPSLPVLFMSGYAQGVLRHRDVPGKGVALIQKPFDDIGLLTRVQEVMAAALVG